MAKAKNPVGLRYWNQCLSVSQQEQLALPDLKSSVIHNGDRHVPWSLPDNSASNMGHDKPKKTFMIRVPNINKQINGNGVRHESKTDWATILAEDEEHKKQIIKKMPVTDPKPRPLVKYPWMKGPSGRCQQEIPGHLDKARGGGNTRSQDLNQTPADKNDHDPRLCFKMLPTEAKNDLTFQHLSTLHSNQIRQGFEYIPTEVGKIF